MLLNKVAKSVTNVLLAALFFSILALPVSLMFSMSVIQPNDVLSTSTQRTGPTPRTEDRRVKRVIQMIQNEKTKESTESTPAVTPETE